MSASMRKKFIVNRRFQYTFIFVMIGISLLSVGIFFVAKHQFFNSLNYLANQLAYPMSHPFREFINNQKDVMNKFFLISAFCNVFFISLLGMVWSNKIAGPIYRIEMLLNKILEENDEVREITVRKNDYFQELLIPINKLLKRIKS